MKGDFGSQFILPNMPILCCHCVVLLYMCWIVDYCYFHGLEFPDVLLLRCFVSIIISACFTFIAYSEVFFFHWHYSPSGPRPTSMQLSVSLRFFFLNHRQSVGLLGRVISSSQGLYLYTNTEKPIYTNTKHPCPELDSNPRSRLPSERRQYMP
jgi:hypothetical protein